MPASDWVWGTTQDIRPTSEGVGRNFWAQNHHQENDGWYYGLQTSGRQLGTQGGPALTKVAAFSVFTGAANRVRMLTASRCELGADSQPGVSCTIPWGWQNNASYQFLMTNRISNVAAECPTATPTACIVYSGYVNPKGASTYTFIASWSLSPGHNGNIIDGDQFLEHPGSGVCGTPSGRYSTPLFKYDVWRQGVVNGADTDQPQPECGRSYMESSATAVIKLVNL